MSSAFDDVLTSSETTDGTERTSHHYDLEEKDDWQTPPELIDPIQRGFGGIDLDPCSHEDTEHGIVNLRLEDGDDGLEADWTDVTHTQNPTVFVNPPFSYKKDWLQKAVKEVQNGVQTVVFVTPDGTDTISWWHQYIAEYSNYVCFCEGRVEYLDDGEDGSSRPPFGTVLTVFGEASDQLISELQQLGHVVQTVSEQ